MTGLEIAGSGLVTPVGRGEFALDAIRQGVMPAVSESVNPVTGEVSRIFAVSPDVISDVGRLPRLRRAGTISAMAVAAGRDALAAAGDEAIAGDRLGLVFATTNGGVVYTRRFFEEIAKSGVQAGSPLLFPETVYNAPGSHVAACLGVGGPTATLVGDGASGLTAFEVASEMLDAGDCDLCLVVGAEEADWITCEAYGAWVLGSSGHAIEPHSGEGAIFADGAAAVLVRRWQGGTKPVIRFGGRESRFSKIGDGVDALAVVVDDLFGEMRPDAWVSSAGGTGLDFVEAGLALDLAPLCPKVSIGESFAAAAVAQVVIAEGMVRLAEIEMWSVLVTNVGFGGSVAALGVEVPRFDEKN